ncbi:M23 family metallopeptidase [Patescibacteria group bacterium]|nr:M23 family metallopeptidase [Patescibacteria group bacterium]MBU1448936.1 M23 family metallopeptidase [Patescibacteria group bacterium]MBU2613151.1 M23 family metallopeptidase [Patescibacteria group bacterium]
MYSSRKTVDASSKSRTGRYPTMHHVPFASFLPHVRLKAASVLAAMHTGKDGTAFRTVRHGGPLGRRRAYVGQRKRYAMNGRSFMYRLAFAAGILITSMLSACEDEAEDAPATAAQDQFLEPVTCAVDAARYPTVPSDLDDIYVGRSFYADGNHLGHDIAYDEGTAIHPIACGTVRVYRPATGYGRLAVVIEHRLASPASFVNGRGEIVTISSFLTIYGHLRSTSDRNGTIGSLDIRDGDTVNPDDVIGYVDDDSHNGDGAEHLHFGVRLQGAKEAKAVDTSWFRGYDGSPSQRKWFADPVGFMATLTSSAVPTRWHPGGTVVVGEDGMPWMVDTDAVRHRIPANVFAQELLHECAIDVFDAELACLEPGEPFVSPRADSRVMKFDDASTVYEYADYGDGGWRRAFITYDAFRSWGWTDADIAIWPSVQRDTFVSGTDDWGFRFMRDGSLVKSDASNEVSVVSDGRRLPIFDWSTFLALGYREERIVVIPDDVIELVAGPRGPLITSDLIQVCMHPSSCIDDCPPSTPGGGGVGGGDGGSGGGEPVPDGGFGGQSGQGGSEPVVDPVPDVPLGKVRFRYDGPVVPGLNQLQGMWDPPGPSFYGWTPSTFALCPDLVAGDGLLECLLDMPSGTVNVLFTVHLADGRWWGDMSYDTTGGQGSTIGTVTLTGPSGDIPYVLVSNGTGFLYMNGLVSVVP